MFGWTLLTAVMIAGMVYTLSAITAKYFSYPVAVNIDVRHSTDLEFPAITICNTSPLRWSLYDRWLTESMTTASPGEATTAAYGSTTSRRRRKRATSGRYIYVVVIFCRSNSKYHTIDVIEDVR